MGFSDSINKVVIGKTYKSAAIFQYGDRSTAYILGDF